MKETALYRRRNNTQNSTQTQNTKKIESKLTKQENRHKKNIKKHKSSS